jgi:hypothetical protein
MRHEDEFGAYALPLLLPAALLAARAVPGRLLVAGLFAGLAVGAVTVHVHDDWPYGREFARDLAELQRDGPLLLIVHRGESDEECRLRNECDAALMHAGNRERSEFFDIKEEVALVPPATFDLVVADYRQRGYRVLLTERAEAFLRGQTTGQALRVHLDARYERQPAGGSTLRGCLLTLRP